MKRILTLEQLPLLQVEPVKQCARRRGNRPELRGERGESPVDPRQLGVDLAERALELRVRVGLQTLLYACTTLSTPSFVVLAVDVERLTRMRLLSRPCRQAHGSCLR